MKFNINTVILVGGALILGGVVYGLQIKSPSESNNNGGLVKQEDRLFPFNKEDITEIAINKQSETLNFVKTSGENPLWEMTQPEKIKANDASMSFLLNLFPEATKQPQIEVTEELLTDYGLKTAPSTLTIKINNGDNYEIKLGNSNFDDTKVYGLVKFPNSGEENIFLLSKSFVYAIDRDLSEWQDNQ